MTGTLSTEPLRFAPVAKTREPVSIAKRGERRAYFEQLGFVTTPVYDGRLIDNGHSVNGPAIIERMGDSVVVPPGMIAAMDEYRSLLLQPEPKPDLSGGELS